ncbi:sigma-70 family RNA polymerase sigma factor [Microbacterium protaetiae]|uniref:Sigma-70 family RNA polymerase sigma factor n=1 Tax=Microbacterium protaetiae TaxID=2509458 RepID=A0A4P6EG83_9MICO|nr:sigma-70 family RNA polymerase sigma factor [Microbacterium protaetiae]QAY60433.1 sigma-70 family RNA polymerase sigma factor [Microbacterium protaetiae]
MEHESDSATRAARAAWYRGLFDEHYAKLVRYVERRITPREDAQQIAADTFEIAWCKLDTAAPDPAGWLYKTAKQKIYNYWTRQKRGTLAMSRAAEVAAPPAVPEDSLDKIAVHRALSVLTQREREVIILTYWEQLDAQAVADRMQMSVTAVWKCVSRARAKLHRALGDDVTFPKRHEPAGSRAVMHVAAD